MLVVLYTYMFGKREKEILDEKIVIKFKPSILVSYIYYSSQIYHRHFHPSSST